MARKTAESRSRRVDATRLAAQQALHAVIVEGQRLDAALTAAQQTLPERRDRALCHHLAAGTVRWHVRLAAIVKALVTRPLRDADVEIVLLMGLYQLLYLRVPDHAAIATSVELAKTIGQRRAAGLVNGVLRRFQRERDAVLQRIDAAPHQRLAYPRWMARQVREAWPDTWEALLEAGNLEAPLTLRVNLQQGSREAFTERLAAAGIEASPTAHAPAGLNVTGSPHPTDLPGFDAGAFAVQDAASQLVCEVLGARDTERVLDACAAPGGKTGALAQSGVDIELTALEIDPLRSARIRENADRLGFQCRIVDGDLGDAATWWDGQSFDRILLDVPCTATGIIRRHPDIKLRRSPEEPGRFAAQSLALLHAAWGLLARGGTLVYATCSILPVENAAVVASFLDATADARIHDLHPSWGQAMATGIQILPGEEGMDGFYYARLTKI